MRGAPECEEGVRSNDAIAPAPVRQRWCVAQSACTILFDAAPPEVTGFWCHVRKTAFDVATLYHTMSAKNPHCIIL